MAHVQRGGSGDFATDSTTEPGEALHAPQLSLADKAAIDRAISPTRLTGYLRAAEQDPDRARALYLWDREVSMALLRDIAILEIAMRNAMNAELTRHFGAAWYSQEIGLDDRSRNALSQAWLRLGKEHRTAGHLVAQLTLGFWRDLLEPGAYFGRPPMSFRSDYEALWRTVLHRAFPGGRIEARHVGRKFTRTWTLDIVSMVHATRNRVAHHEPLVNGIPLPGQAQRSVSRLSVPEAHDACLRLARMLDRDLASWLRASSNVLLVFAEKP